MEETTVLLQLLVFQGVVRRYVETSDKLFAWQRAKGLLKNTGLTPLVYSL